MTKIQMGDDNPFGQNNAVVDTRMAVLVDELQVVALTNPSDGRALYGLELLGKINRSTTRSDVLYLMDEDCAAAIVSDLVGLFSRAGEEPAARFLTALNKALDGLPQKDSR